MADKRLFAKAAFMVVSASLFTVGCGDDVTKTTVNETTGIAQLAKGEAFPECASENVGEKLFAADSGAVYYCADGKWQTLNGKDGEAGEKGDVCEEEILSDSSGYKILCGGDSIGVILNGLNGQKGEAGEMCEVESLGDDSGFKVLCAGDSIGVVLNGAQGDSGAPGANAENCTFSDDGYGSVTVNCGTESATLYKAVCGTEPYDPAKSFCSNDGSKNEIVALCNGAAYDLSREFCYDNGTTEAVVELCNGAAYDLSREFCYDNGTTEAVVELCNGAAYDLSREFCYDNGTTEAVVELCNGAAYDLSTEFCCYNGTTEFLVDRCNGATYNLLTHFCKKGSPDVVTAKKFVTTEYLNQELLANGGYGVLLDERDGQAYRTIQIGTQTWMAQNLNYAYNEGSAKSYCYDNNAENCEKYGRLYLWSAAMDSAAVFSEDGRGCGNFADCTPADTVQGVCPEGWHLPDATEWGTLLNAVGGKEIAATKLKSTSGWRDDRNGTDDFGFSALPAGSRDGTGSFYDVGSDAEFCSVTEDGAAYAYAMFVHLSMLEGESVAGLRSGNKNYSRSVRCLRDSGL